MTARVDFFKTPKGLLTIVLVILAAMAAPHEGSGSSAPGLLARGDRRRGLLDAVILRTRHTRGTFRAAPC